MIIIRWSSIDKQKLVTAKWPVRWRPQNSILSLFLKPPVRFLTKFKVWEVARDLQIWVNTNNPRSTRHRFTPPIWASGEKCMFDWAGDDSKAVVGAQLGVGSFLWLVFCEERISYGRKAESALVSTFCRDNGCLVEVNNSWFRTAWTNWSKILPIWLVVQIRQLIQISNWGFTAAL